MKSLIRAMIVLLVLVTVTSFALAQEEASARWTVSFSKKSPAVGDEVELTIVARLAPGSIVYSTDFKADLGPQPTQFIFEPDESYQLIGATTSVNPQRKKDRTWETEFGYFEERAEFRQKIRVLKKDPVVAGHIKGQLCNEHEGTCTLFDEPFHL